MTIYQAFKYGMPMAVLLIGLMCVILGFQLHRILPGAPGGEGAGGTAKTWFGTYEIKNAAPGTFFLCAGVLLILASLYDASQSSPQSLSAQVARSVSLKEAANDAARTSGPPAVSVGARASAVVVRPVSASAGSPTSFREPTGASYRKTADGWSEFARDGDTVPMAVFSESFRDDTYVILYDRGRDMYVRLPLKGGMADWSHTNPVVWIPMYFVAPSSGVPSGAAG